MIFAALCFEKPFSRKSSYCFQFLTCLPGTPRDYKSERTDTPPLGFLQRGFLYPLGGGDHAQKQPKAIVR